VSLDILVETGDLHLDAKSDDTSSWHKTENNRDARFYSLTKPGERALKEQAERWPRLTDLVNKLLLESSACSSSS